VIQNGEATRGACIERNETTPFDSNPQSFHDAAAATKVARAFQRVNEKPIFLTIVTR
jgi:hypothetical protein